MKKVNILSAILALTVSVSVNAANTSEMRPEQLAAEQLFACTDYAKSVSKSGLGDYTKAYDFLVCAGFNDETANNLAAQINQKFVGNIIDNCLKNYAPVAHEWVQNCKK